MKRHALGLLALLGCDPILSIQGTVRGQSLAGPRTALPGADVALVCPSFRNPLARTDHRGAFEYANVGWWPRGCVIEVSTLDGSHRATMRSIDELCRESGESSECLRISGMEFVLHEARVPPESLRLAFQPDRQSLELVQHRGSSDQVLCSGPCEAEVLAGAHFLSVRLERTTRNLWTEVVLLSDSQTLKADFIEDPDPAWLHTLGVATAAAGSVLLAYGALASEGDLAIIGGSALAVGLTVTIVWKSGMHSARVSWEPRAPSQRAP